MNDHNLVDFVLFFLLFLNSNKSSLQIQMKTKKKLASVTPVNGVKVERKNSINFKTKLLKLEKKLFHK